MLDEERIILMTKMQAYEDGPGKKDVAIANYFRGDYIGSQMLRSGICMTIVLAILFACYVLYDFENIMKSLYQIDLMEYLAGLAQNYLSIVVIFVLITYIVYAFRYTRAKKNLKKYYGDLKKLNAMYNSQEN